jgi:Fuc2NAc and GlcNAc transferase
VAFALILLVAAGCAASTKLMQRYALSRSLLDIPNERSSHSVATPRGGGLAIAGFVVIGLVVGAAAGWIGGRLALALGGGAVLVSVIGFIDDHRNTPAALRLTVHAAAAVWALWLLGGLPWLTVGSVDVHLGAAGSVLALVGIIWSINLYNFMDGIDGLAAGEGTSVGLIAALLLIAAQAPGLALVAALIAAACGGFLAWNWAPAKIFMGDVGSGLLGYLFAVLAISAENMGSLPLMTFVILLGGFVFDATVTLARRIIHGEAWYEAHRRHAYQRAVQSGWSHGRVTTAFVIVNVALGALAAIAWAWPWTFGPVAAAAVFLLCVPYLLIERRRPMMGARPRAAAAEPVHGRRRQRAAS